MEITQLSEKILALYDDEPSCAKCVGLTYLLDLENGYTRVRNGSDFIYRDRDSDLLNENVLKWITSLAIPPSWNNVKIARNRKAHLLSIGIDEAERKQYLYHEKWRKIRTQLNGHRLLPFGEKLGKIRRYVRKELSDKSLRKELLIAAVIRLIDDSSIRIGNELYATEHSSYGATTLLEDHVAISQGIIQLNFVGKSGKEHHLEFRDVSLANVLEQLDSKEGNELFSYEDEEGLLHTVTSMDINSKLREITGFGVTAKDFRTWRGTVTAFEYAIANEDYSLSEVYSHVAEKLGNTPAMARDHYIHQGILHLIQEKAIKQLLEDQGTEQYADLRKNEQRVMNSLQHLAREERWFE